MQASHSPTDAVTMKNDGEVEVIDQPDEQEAEIGNLESSAAGMVEDDDDDEGGKIKAATSAKQTSGWSSFMCYVKSPDFKELLACICLGVFFFLVGYAMDEPRDRPIPKQQLSDGTYILNQMYNNGTEGDTVPNWALGVIVVGCPVVQFFLSLFVGETRDFHRTICVYVLAVPVNELVTWILKAYTGYLRPHFYEGCVPNETYDYCLDPDGEELDMRSSFPSGHASWAFVSLTLFYLYLERNFGVKSIERAYTLAPLSSNEDGPLGKARIRLEYVRPPTIYRLISILCTAPLILAGFTAASRVADNRHHPADIVAGSVLGAFEAYFFYSSWFHDIRFSA